MATPVTARQDPGLIDALFETAAVGLCVCAPDGTIVRANRTFASMLRTTTAALEGRPVVDITHPDDRAGTADRLSEMADRRREVVDVEKRYLRADGSPLWVRVTAVAGHAPDGSVSHFLVTVRDLSATRALSARLRDASERYRQLVEANIIGVTVATESQVIEANDEMLRIVGVTRREFEAHGVDWRAITPPEQLEADFRGLHEIRTRGACVPFEKEFIQPDGSRVPALVGGALIEREPLKWIAFAVDLSDRRRAEEERGRLVQEANAAREVAEAALHARDALLARVSHELRTPLAANVGYASMMLEGIPDPLPDSQLVNVRRMLANQHHLLSLIDGLMDFARGGAGGHAYQLEPLDVGALAAEVEVNVAPQLRAGELTYECPAMDARLAVAADRVKAKQILVNLVANAIKFTDPGGTICVSATSVGNQVHLSVSDTGIGIPSSRVGAVFEPFVQVTPAHGIAAVPGAHGFGLGLAISRELARGMGGDLTVRSIEGEGSTFTLMLPEPQAG